MFSKKPLDLWLILPVILLSLTGVGIIASVYSSNLLNHIGYLLIALVFFLFFFLVDREILFPFARYLFLFSTLLLILPFIIGTVTRGAVRWVPIGSFTFQPSEVVKPFIALFIATFWGKIGRFNLKSLIALLLVVSPAVLMVFFQPDLGSTLVIVVGVAASVFFSGIKVKQLILLVIIIGLLLPIGWFFLKDYQKLRVVHFINPYSDPLGAGYNTIQARIAVGSGGLLGKGIGMGTQSHLAFLPERHTDFIFASLAEELGFVGCSLVIFIYLMLYLRIIFLSRKLNSQVDSILLIVILSMLVFQTLVNIGMNIGLLPITGVTLPLVSYGGNSLIASAICLGLIANIVGSSYKHRYWRIK